MRREIVFALLNGLNLGIVIMNLPPILSDLMELYGVSYTQISVLLSALLWPHAAMQLPAGMITDRLGIRRTQLVSLACMSLGNALPVVSPVLAWGLGGRMITGLGTGMGWLATLKMLAISAPEGRAGAYQAFFADVPRRQVRPPETSINPNCRVRSVRQSRSSMAVASSAVYQANFPCEKSGPPRYSIPPCRRQGAIRSRLPNPYPYPASP